MQSLQLKDFSTNIIIIGGRIYTTIHQAGKGHIPNLPKRKRKDKKGKRANTHKIKFNKNRNNEKGTLKGIEK